MTMKQRVKLISDGTAIGTKLIDPETGEPLPIMDHVREIRWHVESGDLAICEVDLVLIEIDVIGEMAEQAVLPDRTS
jgi:hypothetical protein